MPMIVESHLIKKKNLCQLNENNNKKVYQKYSRGIDILVLGCAAVCFPKSYFQIFQLS